MILYPELPIQVAILNGLGDMLGLDVRGGGQVGNGAGHLEDAVVGPRAEIKLGDRHFQLGLRIGLQGAMLVQFLRPHTRVTAYLAQPLACRAVALERRLEPLVLNLPRDLHRV